MKGSGSARNESGGEPPFRFQDGVLTLRLHVQPGASHSGWAGRHGDALKLRLAAPAVEGRANRACVRFLAEAAGVPAQAVQVVRGTASRAKTVRIEAVSEERFRALASQWSS